MTTRFIYVNIDLRHQYVISVAESQTLLLAKSPERGETSAVRRLHFHIPPSYDEPSISPMIIYHAFDDKLITKCNATFTEIRWKYYIYVYWWGRQTSQGVEEERIISITNGSPFLVDYEKKDFKEGKRYIFHPKAQAPLGVSTSFTAFVCQVFLALTLTW